MTTPRNLKPDEQISELVASLDSLRDGERAMEMLVARGAAAVPCLADFLLNRPPRTIALPRCRAVRALGELGACSTLIAYFRQYVRPADDAVLFAEDAVRSAAATELARYPSTDVFQTLLDAARDRATGGLVLALGEFHRPEAIPLLFEVLEDDLCRDDAMKSLRQVPEAVRQFAILTVRGLTGITLEGPGAIRRARATLQLLSEVGIDSRYWPELRKYLAVDDAATVIAAATIGFAGAREADWPELAAALLRVADHVNSVEEEEIERLLDGHKVIATAIATEIARQRCGQGERPRWLSPFWRILNHALSGALEKGRFMV